MDPAWPGKGHHLLVARGVRDGLGAERREEEITEEQLPGGER
jgi:hypothetical protein